MNASLAQADASAASRGPSRRTAVTLTALMLGAAAAGSALRISPRERGATAPDFQLDRVIPSRFASWEEQVATQVQVINPQTQELLDKLYAQVLTRTYRDADGYAVMLSIAYGDDQRGGLHAHRPEVCYPAQGFTLQANVAATITTPFGTIAGRRLETRLQQRQEPVTYWFAAGNTVVDNRWQLRLLEARLWLTGQIPDGVLFRVSSIDTDSGRAFDRQQAFVADLLRAIEPRHLARLTGLSAAPTPA